MTVKDTFVAAVVTEGDETYLMLGEGDHECVRWRLSEAQAKKLFRELFERLY